MTALAIEPDDPPGARVRQYHTGHIMALLRRAMRDSAVVVSPGPQNGLYGVHQALVRLDDDPIDYRLLLAPANAPIFIIGQPIDHHFGGAGLGDR